MKTKRIVGKIIAALALATVMAIATETHTHGKAAAAPKHTASAAKATLKEIPEPSTTSAAIIGAIGLFFLLGRRR